ncbi:MULTISPECIES: hypothetical protein [unclassified Streptomyces]|nr:MULTISPECIES: hypothetical protein [unclassified Streptomyces]MCJ0868786.1 hypothetical protein [Streptomyces sp. AP-93]
MKKPLLFLAYYLIVTPVGAVQRLLRDPMQRRIQRDAESYWTVAPVRR